MGLRVKQESVPGGSLPFLPRLCRLLLGEGLLLADSLSPTSVCQTRVFEDHISPSISSLDIYEDNILEGVAALKVPTNCGLFISGQQNVSASCKCGLCFLAQVSRKSN